MADIDLLQDALIHAQQRRDSLLSFTSSAVGQRVKFHQDITGLSIILLGGIVALFNINSSNLVKTSWLLYSAGGFLIVCALLCIFIRIKLLEFLQENVATIESRAAKIYGSVKHLRSLLVMNDPPAREDEKAVAINNLITAENPTDNFPPLGKTAEQGHKWVAILFSAALLQIALALLVKITG